MTAKIAGSSPVIHPNIKININIVLNIIKKTLKSSRKLQVQVSFTNSYYKTFYGIFSHIIFILFFLWGLAPIKKKRIKITRMITCKPTSGFVNIRSCLSETNRRNVPQIKEGNPNNFGRGPIV